MAFKLALSAGHYMHTAGKRCLKSIDPNETREWWLNDRVADRIQVLLAEYDGIEVKRLDDTTGKTDVSLKARSDAANNWKADFYLAVHHNAGINGGSIATGFATKSIGDASLSAGHGTKAVGFYSVALGSFNIGKEDTLLEVGNGVSSSDDSKRSNAFEVYKDGRAAVAKDPKELMDVATKQYVDNNLIGVGTSLPATITEDSPKFFVVVE